MGRTHDIPREQWESFFDAVAKKEQHRSVRVEIDEPGIGAQALADHVPLLGVSLERRGGSDVDVTLEAGGHSGGFRHRVPHAERVYALEADDGRLSCLDIEAEGASHTLVYFE
jgi:hypothetical protein